MRRGGFPVAASFEVMLVGSLAAVLTGAQGTCPRLSPPFGCARHQPPLSAPCITKGQAKMATDIYATITQSVIAAMETATGEYTCPWHTPAASQAHRKEPGRQRKVVFKFGVMVVVAFRTCTVGGPATQGLCLMLSTRAPAT